TLALPAAGTYQLRVRGYRVPSGPQAFSLAYEVAGPDLEWLTPGTVRNVRPTQTTLLRWDWAGPATLARLDYRPVGQAAWRTVASQVDLSQHTYAWTAPDTTTLAQLRYVAGRYFAVAPVLGGKVAERSATINLDEAGVGCYIQSFLPQLPVTDTARLVLALGTLYRLRAVQLQRLGPNGFATVQTLNPVTQSRIIFTDLGAAPGLNQYRVLGQDDAGRTFYSTTEAVQLVRRNELLVFPVPAIIGQDLQVAGEPNVPLHLHLYDTLGRLLREADVEGALNTFPTSSLRPGVYLLRATPATGGGATLTRRIVLAE
nr:hypothetical protein [Tanacetum cinerariifolium]